MKPNKKLIKKNTTLNKKTPILDALVQNKG